MKKIILLFICYNSCFLFGQIPSFPMEPCPPDGVLGCDENRILEYPGVGATVNDKRHGFWHESLWGKPYAMGKYLNGKKDSTWTFFYINSSKIDTSLKTFASIKDFEKGKKYCTAEFKNGRLNGNYVWYYSNGKIFEKRKYRGDTIIDTLFKYLENGKLSYSSNYNNCYFDTTWIKSRQESYLKGRLPFINYYSYPMKNYYLLFEGYGDGASFLFYDKKTKKIIKRSSGRSSNESMEDLENAEGTYSEYPKNELFLKTSMEDGRKRTIVNKRLNPD